MNMLNLRIRHIRILTALVLGLLALCLCYAGAVSYRGSPCSNPPSVTVDTSYYDTLGQPANALITDEGYVLVSVSGGTVPNSGCPNAPPNGGVAGVEVFNADLTPACLIPASAFPVALPSPRPVVSVFGMKSFPRRPQQTRETPSIGAAVEAQGAEFFRLTDFNACTIDGIVNVQQPPQVLSGCKTCAPGTFDLAVTPDGQYAFVANEYGLVPGVEIHGSGTIGVTKIRQDAFGRFTNGTELIARNPYIYVEGGGAIPGVTISHDGKHLYVTSEVARDEYRDPTHSMNEILTNTECRNEGPNGGLSNNGLLTVIDVDKARKGAGQGAIMRTIASGCAPVRAVETADGKYIWVATRGGDPGLLGVAGRVLAFDVDTLLSDSPNNALSGYGDSGGPEPVGMALFDNDQLLAVANSNRYLVPNRVSNVAILHVCPSGGSGAVTVVRRIDSPDSFPDSFPRDVTLGPDGSTLYVPNFCVNRLEVIKTFVCHQAPH
jgi:hypothetical protein